MSYIRVIPRDLFNESKLLKCLGKLCLLSDIYSDDVLAVEHNGSPFRIEQDPSSGAIYATNVNVFVNGVPVHVYTTLNARGPMPLCFDYKDDADYVFADDEGSILTKKFKNIGRDE